ncbi:MAG: hypothetical protein LBO05_14710, partial [Deltaproteobacteria bacterium]|nr:hypothetical protein [Deltaproteobacteria bacterium]
MYYVNIISSVVSFCLSYVLLTLALSFWGKQTLRLLRYKDTGHYGDLKLIVAGIGSMIFLSQAIILFMPDYFAFLSIFFIVGTAGSLVELLIFVGAKTRSEKQSVASILRESVRNHESFLIALITAAVLAFFYSAAWPSGELDLWMNNGGDFYSWITFADYLVGGLNPDIFPYDHKLVFNTMDAFGTSLFIDYVAAANNLSPVLAAPSCVLTIL